MSCAGLSSDHELSKEHEEIIRKHYYRKGKKHGKRQLAKVKKDFTNLTVAFMQIATDGIFWFEQCDYDVKCSETLMDEIIKANCESNENSCVSNVKKILIPIYKIV